MRGVVIVSVWRKMIEQYSHTVPGSRCCHNQRIYLFMLCSTNVTYIRRGVYVLPFLIASGTLRNLNPNTMSICTMYIGKLIRSNLGFIRYIDFVCEILLTTENFTLTRLLK